MRLTQAYTNAIYQINTDPPLALRINRQHPFLHILHSRYGCTHSIVLSACNPHSRLLRPASNNRRIQALHRTLQALGQPCLAALNLDPLGQWPDEPSVWLPGLSLDNSLILARRFKQNALVWCGPDTLAQLIWTAKPSDLC